MSIPSASPSAFCWKPSWQQEAPSCDSLSRCCWAGCAGSGQHAGRGCLSSVIGEHPLGGTPVPPMWAVCVAGSPCRRVLGGGGETWPLGKWGGGNGAYVLGPTGLLKVFWFGGDFFVVKYIKHNFPLWTF